MPYQDFNTDDSKDMTPEEYVRLLAIQRRMLQNPGAATSRRQGNSSFPFHKQQPMQDLLHQRMMQALQNMDCHPQGSASRHRQLRDNTLHQSISSNATTNDCSYGTGIRRSRLLSNLSRSSNAAATTSDNFGLFESSIYHGDTQGPSNPKNLVHSLHSNDNAVSSRTFVANGRPSSFSRSWDPRFNGTADFDNTIMAASAPAISAGMRFACHSNEGGTINNNCDDTSPLFLPAHSAGGFFAHSTFTQEYLSSSPPLTLPSNTTNIGAPPNEFRSICTGNSRRVDQNDYSACRKDNVVKTSTAFPSPLLQGKRRRLNSDELILDMLSDFMPTGTGDLSGRENDDVKNDRAENANVGNSRCNSPTLSPFSRRTVCSPLTPLNHAHGYVDSNSPMGQTPIMFAKYFLGAREDDNKNGTAQRAVPPRPPLYQEDEPNSGKYCSDGGMGGIKRAVGHQGVLGGFCNTTFRPRSGDCFPVPKFRFNEVQFDPAPANVLDDEELLLQKFRTPFSSEPLCLPPRRKKDSTSKMKKKVASKKSKEEVSGSPSRAAITNVTTPSSAAIVALTTEIRSQIKSSPAAAHANECSSPNTSDDAVDSSAKETDFFSIPQFATSMEASQYSQQTIHDWDKKFGLRRAHSKTMRESARSRKKVLEFLKGEGASLWKSAVAVGLSDSTSSAATTLASSWSGVSANSMMPPSEEVNRVNVETANEGLDEEHSEALKEQQMDEVTHEHCDAIIKQESIKDCHMQEKARAISSTNENDDENSVESIGSFSHDYEEGQDEKEHLSEDSHKEFISSYSSKMLDFDIEDEDLNNMFRRASLDHCTRRPSLDHCTRRSSSICIPLLEETCRRQSFAKSA